MKSTAAGNDIMREVLPASRISCQFEQAYKGYWITPTVENIIPKLRIEKDQG